MILIRKRSPLCVGIGDDEMFIASDPLAFAGKTKKVLFIPDESFALVKKDMIELYDFTGKALPLSIQELELDWEDLEKKGMSITCSKKFMIKKMQSIARWHF